ncbi:MAG: alkaline phosphatase family protein [Planctomycetes bacterium]|nr:alkaline phosphatase family protein [Planctomycetota bacterium]
MLKRPLVLGVLIVAAVAATAGFFLIGKKGTPAQQPKVRLAVLIVFDQLRGDYLGKWDKLFVEGGFRRLMKEGAWFTNCHYPYAATITGPGHASLVTGTSPSRHGIIANEWYDREKADLVPAVLSEQHRPIPAPAHSAKALHGAAPLRRRQPSLGDALLDASKGKSRVVSLSLKDRSAILLAALRAICCWFSTSAGAFVSSSYYTDALPRWVTDFNRGARADSFFDHDWDRLLPKLDYARHSGPDNVAAEGIGYDQGQTFPHPTNGGLKKPGQDYYQAMLNTPYGNQMLLELAKIAIDAEKLGQGQATDFLCLSFSSNDLIGHCWGPDSQEVLDITLRSDRVVKELLDHLDDRVGAENYVIAISADHGICPIPEVAKAAGKKAGRVSPQLLTTDAIAFLSKRFAAGKMGLPWLEEAINGQIYLNRRFIRELGLDTGAVGRTLAEWLGSQPGVLAAFSSADLAGEANSGLREQVRQSFDPERSGDVVVVLQPYHLLSPPISPRLAAYRTTHGSPHPYDTHVPLLIYGGGIRPGVHDERIAPQAVVPVISRALSITPPAGCDTALPHGLFP